MQKSTNDYYVLDRSVETLDKLSVSVDLIYIDPPFNLSKRFEMDGDIGFNDYFESEDSYLIW